MIRIAHLRDEAEIGGVARMVQFLMRNLGPEYQQAEVCAAPLRLRPLAIDADVLVVHITTILTKLPYLAALRMARPRRPVIRKVGTGTVLRATP